MSKKKNLGVPRPKAPGRSTAAAGYAEPTPPPSRKSVRPTKSQRHKAYKLALEAFDRGNGALCPPNVEACRSAPVRWACVSGRIEASVCCTPPFHSLKL